MTVADDARRNVEKNGQNLEENTSERRFFMHFSLNLFCGHVEANVEVDAVTEIVDRVHKAKN